MALAFTINKKAYEALSDEMKAEYIAGEKAGEYVLDVSGLPEPEDTGPLNRALESERAKVKTLTKDKKDLQQKIDEFPDVDALKAEHAATTDKYKKFTETALIDGAALALASKISTSPALLLPHIKSRLVADMEGDTPTTKVLGLDGKASDLTIDKLGEEFVANKDFASIIIASKASGGGTPPFKPGSKPIAGGTPANGEPPADMLFSKMTPEQRVAAIQAKKAGGQEAQQ